MANWRSLLLEPMPEEIREQIVAAFEAGKVVILKPHDRGNSRDFAIEVLDHAPPHCVTCQCNRINQPPPVPGNEMSKVWHHLAAGKPSSTG